MSRNELHCYTRVSSKGQATAGASLDVQSSTAKEIAKKLNLKFVHRDEGAKSSLSYRDELEALKYDIEQKKVKHLWCFHTDRLYRDNIEMGIFRRDYLEKHDVNLYIENNVNALDFDDFKDDMIYNILAVVQEAENKNRKFKSRSGKLRKLEKYASMRSVYLGGTHTYGYTSTADTKEWIVNKDEAKIVKEIFESYANDKSIKEIADSLDKRAVEARRASIWNHATILKMLQNKTYSGLHTRREFVDTKREKTFNFAVQRIVTKSLFDKVQRKIAFNRNYQDNNKKHFSLLEDIMFCECGTRCISREFKNTDKSQNKATRAYYCQNKVLKWRNRNIADCKNMKSFNMDKTNDYVLEQVKEVVRNSAVLKERFKKEVLSEHFEKKKNIKDEEKKLEDKVQRIHSQIESIEDKIAELEFRVGTGEMEKSVAQKVEAKYNEYLKQQNDEYDKAEAELENLANELSWIDWVSKYSERLDLDTSSEQKQKEFLKGLLKKIIVKSEYAIVRKKEQQIGHSLELHFNLKIVNDSIVYEDENIKSLGYKVVSGSNKLQTEAQKFVTSRNTKAKKKRVMKRTR